MLAVIEFIFSLLLFLIGCLACGLAVYSLVCFVIAAAKKIKEEVQKDGRTE